MYLIRFHECDRFFFLRKAYFFSSFPYLFINSSAADIQHTPDGTKSNSFQIHFRCRPAYFGVFDIRFLFYRIMILAVFTKMTLVSVDCPVFTMIYTSASWTIHGFFQQDI
ncbi:hypothetical protein Barb4_04056 [Bacteroidales bacterium Barb4]|nr:hypothetical protein Barb4_04056 [Bacteroidales bacterium Barb4]